MTEFIKAVQLVQENLTFQNTTVQVFEATIRYHISVYYFLFIRELFLICSLSVFQRIPSFVRQEGGLLKKKKKRRRRNREKMLGTTIFLYFHILFYIFNYTFQSVFRVIKFFFYILLCVDGISCNKFWIFLFSKLKFTHHNFYAMAVSTNFVDVSCGQKNWDFYCNIFRYFFRVLGSLLSAHLLISDPNQPFGDLRPTDYNDELLNLSHDLASRLMSAFENTATGIPFPRVSLVQYNQSSGT